MNDNCENCGRRRYVDPPLPDSTKEVICAKCNSSSFYILCEIHHTICTQHGDCFDKSLEIRRKRLNQVTERLALPLNPTPSAPPLNELPREMQNPKSTQEEINRTILQTLTDLVRRMNRLEARFDALIQK